jgi:hypothetical protein
VNMTFSPLPLTNAQEITVLLKEYEVCQDSASSLEQVIWQTSAVLGLGSLGSIVALASTKAPFSVVLVIAFLSISASFLWWSAANRWWTIEHLKFERMRQIEDRLGMRQNHYLKYLDDLQDTLKREPFKPRSDRAIAIREHVREALGLDEPTVLRLENIPYQRAGPRDILKWLRWIIPVAWIGYLLLIASPPLVAAILGGFPFIRIWVFSGA